MKKDFSVIVFFTLFLLGLFSLSGCYRMKHSSGGGQKASFTQPRIITPEDIALPKGYHIEVVATDLTFPTAVDFDDEGKLYVVEAGYALGGDTTTPRLMRMESKNKFSTVAYGEKNGPWNGLCYSKGAFYVAEGGAAQGGKILRISKDGQLSVVIDSLPSFGDHHTEGPVLGPDGFLYFGQGSATNSGIVGEDNAALGWLYRQSNFHDIPCQDITLNGENYDSKNPLSQRAKTKIKTGAFSTLGTQTEAGQTIRGHIPCTGSVMRISPTGGRLELIAWGFRNPFGLAFAPDKQLYVTDNGYDERGSRPIWGSADYLWAVKTATWYGWPDYSGGKPVNTKEFRVPGEDVPKLLLKDIPNEAPKPVASLEVHSESNGFDFSRNPFFGYQGQAFIAQFGDMAPLSGKVLAPVGFKVIRVDVKTGEIQEFAVNKGKINGPGSRTGGHGFERPISVKFSPDGKSLYVVDFGVVEMGPKGPEPKKNTGVIWKIVRD
jgi:glucose/arabinose dehydrogenase